MELTKQWWIVLHYFLWSIIKKRTKKFCHAGLLCVNVVYPRAHTRAFRKWFVTVNLVFCKVTFKKERKNGQQWPWARKEINSNLFKMLKRHTNVRRYTNIPLKYSTLNISPWPRSRIGYYKYFTTKKEDNIIIDGHQPNRWPSKYII